MDFYFWSSMSHGCVRETEKFLKRFWPKGVHFMPVMYVTYIHG